MASSSQSRPHFASRLGFVFAAAGSAVGLGNIWGFPTQVANHGGGAFIAIYIAVLLVLAVPALYAELSIGFHARANPVDALTLSCPGAPKLGRVLGLTSIFAAIMMLGFYNILAGWMLAHAAGSVFELFGWSDAYQFVTQNSIARNLIFSGLVVALTASIILAGVQRGIETWSKRLMPLLLALLICLIIYVLTLPGALLGLTQFLAPDTAVFSEPKLYLAAMGQAFFSLSVGVGGMMIYSSYLRKNENLSKLTFSVAGLDTLVAILAGLLIIPALFAAKHVGLTIMSNGELIGRSQLIFEVLPALFSGISWFGILLGAAFFGLMSIASITSTISSCEVPVSYLTESQNMTRRKAVLLYQSTLICAHSARVKMAYIKAYC
ncbi:sodium-dependent transporter [Aliiglaciecola sp.]|nr:sodium-dependent transporter [Aliiglaciecola sp.]